MASLIPNAQLVLLDGESTAPYLVDTETAAAAIDEFLDIENGLTVPRREMDVSREVFSWQTNIPSHLRK